MGNRKFSANLRTMCNRHSSIANVCRELSINRQQFNKYLSGQIFPSTHNFARICRFFNLTGEQFVLEPHEFDQLPSPGTDLNGYSVNRRIDEVVATLPNDIEALARYEGFYNAYYLSMGHPGFLVRALVHIYRYKDQFYSKTREHLWDKQKNDTRRHRYKYRGIVLYVAGRIFITEYEMLIKHNIIHTILVPGFRNVIHTLSGLTTGVSSLTSHLPHSQRTEMQFLGKNADVRAELNNCGLYDLDSPLIDGEIRERIKSEILPHEFMLTARE
jgi:transcriptional regulator with XRE-family HTH domain